MFTYVNNHMRTFVLLMTQASEIERLYKAVKVANFDQRYTPPEALNDLIEFSKSKGIFTALGRSTQGREIGYVELGTGHFKVLAWSQMHGDESTSTRALVDLFYFLNQTDFQPDLVHSILSYCRLRIIFQLNPDGSYAYTRENAIGFDLNRDARDQVHVESKILTELVQEFGPDLCLNCHDQRSLYSLDWSINPPFISFLAPAADEELSLTEARSKAMEHISCAVHFLRDMGFEAIGRYDESYCANCFGDHFQSKGIPTVLIESGHLVGDQQREQSRYIVFLALLGILENNPDSKRSLVDVVNIYNAIPENRNMLRDVVLKNVRYGGKIVDVGIQNRLVLVQGALKSEAYVHDIVPAGTIMGYQNYDAESHEILINSHENDFEDKIIVSILLKKSDLLIKI